MKTVSILLLNDVNLAGMENARQGLLEANRFLEDRGEDPIFNVELVALQPFIQLNQGLYVVHADRVVEEVTETDIIIIPPVLNDIGQAIRLNAGFCPWIIDHYKSGTEVVSLCLGAFILACTGLLDGKKCATHWRAADQFRKLFPKTDLVTDKILTYDNGIYTGGGAFSSANLILYLIEKSAGREAAIYCSKMFQIDFGRNSQSPFIIFEGQKDHTDEGVKEAQAYIEKKYEEKITVDSLCEMFSIGRRTFERRFKKATGNTVVEYIQRVKVEAAKHQLEKGTKTVNEVMYDVGYIDPKAFRDVFRKYSGLSPTAYRDKYVRSLEEVW